MTNWNKYSEIEKAKISYQKEQIDIKRKAWEKSDDEWGPKTRQNWRSLNNAKKRLRNYPALKRMEESGHKVQDMNQGYQFRIDNKVDIFPTNKRYHILSTGERGHYNNLNKLIKRSS